MSVQFTVFLDANVLYPAPLRDLLLELAVADLYQARWSAIILEEMKRNILINRPDITERQIDRTISLMNRHTRDCLVNVPQTLIDAIEGLPDADDRHVVAGALQSRSHAIITRNLKDFPSEIISAYRLEAIDPDKFLSAQYTLDQGGFMQCARTVRARLKKPELSVDAYLSILIRNGLVETAGLLRPMSPFI